MPALLARSKAAAAAAVLVSAALTLSPIAGASPPATRLPSTRKDAGLGWTVTLYAFKFNEATWRAGAKVGICSSVDYSTDGNATSYFLLRVSTGNSVPASQLKFAGESPLLPNRFKAHTCVRGWVTWILNPGWRPVSLSISGLGTGGET